MNLAISDVGWATIGDIVGSLVVGVVVVALIYFGSKW